MTGIDCLTAEKNWKQGAKQYLIEIGYVSIEEDEEGTKYISLFGDEEGNFDTKLNKKSSLWLAKQLKELSKELK